MNYIGYTLKGIGDTLTSVIERHSCCVCNNLPRLYGPIFQCQQEHLICNMCMKQLRDSPTKCPMCRTAEIVQLKSRITLQTITDLAKLVLYECTHGGCSLRIPLEQIEHHDHHCPKYASKCPKDGCTFEFNFHDPTSFERHRHMRRTSSVDPYMHGWDIVMHISDFYHANGHQFILEGMHCLPVLLEPPPGLQVDHPANKKLAIVMQKNPDNNTSLCLGVRILENHYLTKTFGCKFLVSTYQDFGFGKFVNQDKVYPHYQNQPMELFQYYNNIPLSTNLFDTFRDRSMVHPCVRCTDKAIHFHVSITFV